MKYLLGIDVGTTSLKAAVFDGNGNRLGLRSRDYTLDTHPDSGFIEFEQKKHSRTAVWGCFFPYG